jgi:hypothetical protein
MGDPDTITNSTPKAGRSAPRSAPPRVRTQDPLLDLAQLADLPFGARWLFLANSHLRGQLSGSGWGGFGLPSLLRTPGWTGLGGKGRFTVGLPPLKRGQ